MEFDFDYVTVKLMLTIFKAIGLAPFDLQRSVTSKLWTTEKRRNPASLQFLPSHLGCLWNCFLIAVQLWIFILAWPNAYSDDYPGKSDTTVAISVAASVFCNFTLFAIYFSIGFRQKAAVSLLNRLLKVDIKIVNKNSDQACKSSRLFFFLTFIIYLFICAGLGTTGVLAYHYPVLTYLGTDWPAIIIGWFVISYTFMIKLSNNRLRYFNRFLYEHYVTLSSNGKDDIFLVREISLIHLLPSQIMSFRRVYEELHDIVIEVSAFYSLPILLAIAQSCVIVIYNGYYLILSLLKREEESDVIVANTVLCIVSAILPIVMLASEITDYAAKMNTTRNIVSKLRMRWDFNEDIHIELQRFVFDLMHRNVEFTACGFFSLDLSLVHSVLSMVATYLIILVQHRVGSAS